MSVVDALHGSVAQDTVKSDVLIFMDHRWRGIVNCSQKIIGDFKIGVAFLITAKFGASGATLSTIHSSHILSLSLFRGLKDCQWLKCLFVSLTDKTNIMPRSRLRTRHKVV